MWVEWVLCGARFPVGGVTCSLTLLHIFFVGTPADATLLPGEPMLPGALKMPAAIASWLGSQPSAGLPLLPHTAPAPAAFRGPPGVWTPHMGSLGSLT